MWRHVFNLIDKVKKLRNILHYAVWDLCRKERVIITMLSHEYREHVYFVFLLLFLFLCSFICFDIIPYLLMESCTVIIVTISSWRGLYGFSECFHCQDYFSNFFKLKVVFFEKFQEYHDIVVSFNLSSSSESN